MVTIMKCLKAIAIIMLLVLITDCKKEPVTKINSAINRLIRKKRHLQFPEGSLFVMTASIVKAIMTQIPKGWNVLVEGDVIYKLPTKDSYPKKLKHKMYYHRLHRREIYTQLEDVLNTLGLEGKHCLNRMMCEADEILSFPDKTLAEELIATIFSYPKDGADENDEYVINCSDDFYEKCPISLMNVVLNPEN